MPLVIPSKIKSQKEFVMTNKKKNSAEKKVMNNTLANTILDELLTVNDEQKKWTLGAYKKENEGLYAILQSCYRIVRQIRESNIGVRNELDNLLKEHQITFNKGTSIEAKVIRCAFGIDSAKDKRVFKYKRVLERAFTDEIPEAELAQWISDGNGIENVQSKKEQERVDAAAKRVNEEITKAYSMAMLAPQVAIEKAKPSTGNLANMSVALVRHNKANGTNEIIGLSDSNAITYQLFQLLRKNFISEVEKKLNDEQAENETEVRNAVRAELETTASV